MKYFFRTLFLLATIGTGRGESTDLSDSFTFAKSIGPQATPEDITISGVCFHLFYIVADPGHSSEFEIQASIASKRELRNVRVTLEQGEYGTASFLRVPLFSAATLSNPSKLPPFTVGKKNSSAYFLFWAEEFSGGKQTKLHNSRISLADLLSSNRHNPLQPSPPR